MSQSSAFRSDPAALAAAMSRHPAAGSRAGVTPLFGTAPAPRPQPPVTAPGPASFATVAALLTGPWRVNDPVGFDGAMRAAPLIAGHPVVDLAACAQQPTAGFDPLSAALAGGLESAVAGAAFRAGLIVRCVAAPLGADLLVEAAARAAADAGGPELMVLAHLVEPGVSGPGRSGRPVGTDDSWLVVVVGDGRGAVAAVGRLALSRPPEKGPGPAARAAGLSRLALGPLRARLVAPALAAEGASGLAGAVVLPFRRCVAQGPGGPAEGSPGMSGVWGARLCSGVRAGGFPAPTTERQGSP